MGTSLKMFRRRLRRQRPRVAQTPDAPPSTFRYVGEGPRRMPARLRAKGIEVLQPGDTFTDSRNWAKERHDFELVEARPEPDTLTVDQLRALSWADARAYALDHYGIKARGWRELTREYELARG